METIQVWETEVQSGMRENCVRWVRARRVGVTREEPPESMSYWTRCKMEEVEMKEKEKEKENTDKGNREDEGEREETDGESVTTRVDDIAGTCPWPRRMPEPRREPLGRQG